MGENLLMVYLERRRNDITSRDVKTPLAPLSVQNALRSMFEHCLEEYRV